MTTQMQDTSLEAFEIIRPTLNKRQQEVYRYLQMANEPRTNREIAEGMGLDTCCITGRMNELVAKEYVEEKGRRKDWYTGFSAITWGLVKKEQLELF